MEEEPQEITDVSKAGRLLLALPLVSGIFLPVAHPPRFAGPQLIFLNTAFQPLLSAPSPDSK